MIPAPVFGEDLLRRYIGAVIQAEQDVAVRQGKVGPQGQRLAQRRLGFGEPALAHQRQAQIVVRIGIRRVAGDGLARAASSALLRVSRKRQHPGQIDPGIGEVRREADRRADSSGAFVEAAGVAQDVAQIVVRGDTIAVPVPARGAPRLRPPRADPACAGSPRGWHAVRPAPGRAAMAACRWASASREPMVAIGQQAEHMMCLGVRVISSQHALRQFRWRQLIPPCRGDAGAATSPSRHSSHSVR